MSPCPASVLAGPSNEAGLGWRMSRVVKRSPCPYLVFRLRVAQRCTVVKQLV